MAKAEQVEMYEGYDELSGKSLYGYETQRVIATSHFS